MTRKEVMEMKHLTIDEMLDFVSMTELNGDAMKLAAYITKHIRECDSCMKQVRALQMVYDEFSALNTKCSLKDFLAEKAPDLEKLGELQEKNVEKEYKEADGLMY